MLISSTLATFQIPESATLHYGIDRMTGKRSKFPIVALKNVFVFPGVPILLERAFSMLEVKLSVFKTISCEGVDHV